MRGYLHKTLSTTMEFLVESDKGMIWSYSFFVSSSR